MFKRRYLVNIDASSANAEPDAAVVGVAVCGGDAGVAGRGRTRLAGLALAALGRRRRRRRGRGRVGHFVFGTGPFQGALGAVDAAAAAAAAAVQAVAAEPVGAALARPLAVAVLFHFGVRFQSFGQTIGGIVFVHPFIWPRSALSTFNKDDSSELANQ